MYHLNEEELETLIKSLRVYAGCLTDPVKKLKAAPIVGYNLDELAQHLRRVDWYPSGYEDLLAEVLFLLWSIRDRESDQDLLKLIDQCIGLLEKFSIVKEKHTQYYAKYGIPYSYPKYYYPKTKKEKYFASLQKAREYLEKQNAQLNTVDHLDFVVYDLASSAGHKLNDLLKERPSLDQAIVDGCKRLIDELEREQRQYQERLQLEARIQELSKEKEKLRQVKKRLLDRCILALCEEWKEREQ